MLDNNVLVAQMLDRKIPTLELVYSCLPVLVATTAANVPQLQPKRSEPPAIYDTSDRILQH